MLYAVDRETPIGEVGGGDRNYLVGSHYMDAPETELESAGYVSVMGGDYYAVNTFPHAYLDPEAAFPYQALLPRMSGDGIVTDSMNPYFILTILKNGLFLKSFVYDAIPDEQEFYRLAASYDIDFRSAVDVKAYVEDLRASQFWAAGQYAEKLSEVRKLRVLAAAGLAVMLILLPLKGLDFVKAKGIEGRIEKTKVEIASLESQVRREKQRNGTGQGIPAREFVTANRVVESLGKLPDLPVRQFEAKTKAVLLKAPHPSVADEVVSMSNGCLVDPHTVAVPLPDFPAVASERQGQSPPLKAVK